MHGHVVRVERARVAAVQVDDRHERRLGRHAHVDDTQPVRAVGDVRVDPVHVHGARIGTGAYLSTGWSNTFVEGMSAGRGFVALAIVVFARWTPLGAVFGSLLFGLAMALQVRLQGQGGIPYQFFQMLPYALTLDRAGHHLSSRRGGAPAALAADSLARRSGW